MNPYDRPPEQPRWMHILRLSSELTLLFSTSTLTALDAYERFRRQDQRPFGHVPVLPHILNHSDSEEKN